MNAGRYYGSLLLVIRKNEKHFVEEFHTDR